MRLVLTSFTPYTAGGGVPRWNRHIMKAFPEAVHYSWSDVVKEHGDSPLPEWEKAKILNRWLTSKGKVTKDDVVLTDGFWGLGLEDFPKIVSVAHGNWSHTTKADVDAGIKPEFPHHHAVQVDYRRKHLARSGRIVSVSDFIADQCKLQWGFEIPVINNGIELQNFVPAHDRIARKRPLIVHGVTNNNKGYAHIEAVEREVDADVVLLDNLTERFGVPKYKGLAQADLVIIPSSHEGNSYFCLEALSSKVPIVAYAVGLPYLWAKHCQISGDFVYGDGGPGIVIAEKHRRDTSQFVSCVNIALQHQVRQGMRPREWVSQFSVERFSDEWRSYLKREFGYGA